MDFGLELQILFTGMSIPVIILLVAGLVFIGAELFQPGFGVFGILGIISLVISVILRCVDGGGNLWVNLFGMLLFILILTGIELLVMIFLMKKGIILRKGFIEKGTAVSKDRSDGTEDYSILLGKQGEAVTDLRPAGKASFDGICYDVDSRGVFLEKGDKVEVVKTEGVVVYVKKVEE